MAAECRQAWLSLVAMVVVLAFSPVAAATNWTAAEWQSLLVVLDDSGLRIERRLAAQKSHLVGPPKDPDKEKLRRVLRLHAINSVASGKQSLESPAQQNIEYPGAQWFSANGELLASTRFNDPRVLRAPQQGSLVHEAIVAKSVSHFLLRGPIEAARVEIFLPDISGTLDVLPPSSQEVIPVDNSSFAVGQPHSRRNREATRATHWSARQFWAFDL